MMQKFQKQKINILLLLIIISTQVRYVSDAKIKQKKLVNEYNLNGKIKTLTTKEEIEILVTFRIKSRAR